MEELGLVIHMLRRRKGWTQAELARRVDTSGEYISQLETGARTNPSAQLLTRLAVALDTTPDYMLTEAGMLPTTENGPLPPEVLDLAQAIEAYPDGAAKEQAKQMVIDIALILRTLRERMEEQREADPNGGSPV